MSLKKKNKKLCADREALNKKELVWNVPLFEVHCGGCQLVQASLRRNLRASLKPASCNDCMRLRFGGSRHWFRRFRFSMESCGWESKRRSRPTVQRWISNLDHLCQPEHTFGTTQQSFWVLVANEDHQKGQVAPRGLERLRLLLSLTVDSWAPGWAAFTPTLTTSSSFARQVRLPSHCGFSRKRRALVAALTYHEEMAAESEVPASVPGAASLWWRLELDEFRRLLQELRFDENRCQR